MTSRTGTGPVGAGHIPVMLGEVVAWLRPRPGACLIDATVGAGGHAAALLAAAPDARLLGIDRDPVALARAEARLRSVAGRRVVLREGDFTDLPRLLADHGWDAADGIVVDLGVSSLQLDDPARGFTFRADGPLDMRMSPSAELTAASIVNTWPEAELARRIARDGEERHARAVARAIVRARPLRTTTDLARAVGSAVGPHRGGIHPATRTFQAIRIAVNDELGRLERLLADGWALLRPGGRLAILAYHSLEDRRVKEAFRRWAARCHCPPGVAQCVCGWTPQVHVLTRRPLRPDPAEVARNPRARSARLRVVERLPPRAEASA